MQFPSISALLQHIRYAWQRFPAAALMALLGMVLCMIFVEKQYHGQAEDWIPRIIMTIALGMPLLLGIAVAAEAYGWSMARTWLTKGIAVAALGWYYSSLDVSTNTDSAKDIFRFIAFALVAHCWIASAAFFSKKEGAVLSFWEYNKILLAQWIVAAFYGLVLYVGISLAILGIDQLFGLDWPFRVYAHLFFVIALGFHPIYFLSQMPKVYDLSEEDPAYTAAIRNLVKYILIPLTLLYLLILYAYIVKIGIEWAWPKGYVSSLSLGFSMVGILTYLLNYRLVETDDSTFLAWFRRWFFYLLSPIVPVMLLAIGRRLNDYGVTEPRFVVATLGAWLFLVCLYFILSKKDDIRFIPISLGVIAFLCMAGPWGATAVSCRSQFGEMKTILSKNGILVDGKAQPGKGSITEEERFRLSSVIDFLAERHALQQAQAWFSPNLDTIFQKNASPYGVSTAILEYLKLEASASQAQNGSFSFGRLTGGLPAKGYEKLFRIDLYASAEQEFKNDSITLSLNNEAGLKLRSGKSEESLDLKPYIQGLLDKYKDGFYYVNIENPADAFVNLSGKKWEVMLIPEGIGYEINKQQIRINNLNGTLLVKKRK